MRRLTYYKQYDWTIEHFPACRTTKYFWEHLCFDRLNEATTAERFLERLKDVLRSFVQASLGLQGGLRMGESYGLANGKARHNPRWREHV